MHAVLYMFRALRTCPHAKKSPATSHGSKHPFMNIFWKTSLNTFQYPSYNMHALLYTFEAVGNSAYVKKKKTKSPGSKHPFTNIFHEKFHPKSS